jgi:hypothetical protein
LQSASVRFALCNKTMTRGGARRAECALELGRLRSVDAGSTDSDERLAELVDNPLADDPLGGALGGA